jgi:hypothetical protein
MANLINTVDWLTEKSLQTLVNKLEVASRFNTSYNKEYQQAFPVGETVRIKLPQRWITTQGIAYQPQPIQRKYTTVTVNNFEGIHFDYDSVEQALKLERTKEEIFEEYFKPGVEQLQQQIDSDAANFAWQNTNHVVGVLGTAPTSITPFAQARQKLLENAGMTGDMTFVIAPKVNAALAPALTPLLNPTDQISQLFKKGYLGFCQGGEWYENMSLYSATAGSWAGAVTVSGAGQSGSSLTITDTSGDTFNVGDVFTIANVNEVNPTTRRSTGSLKQFVVVQALTGTGSDTLVFSPAIIGPDGTTPDQYQNVDSLPANAAALTLYPGTTSPNAKSGIQNLCFTRDAFALVAVELETPKAVEFASQKRDPKSGVAIRITRTWDAVLSRFINRMDTLYGFGLLYPDNCSCRVASN